MSGDAITRTLSAARRRLRAAGAALIHDPLAQSGADRVSALKESLREARGDAKAQRARAARVEHRTAAPEALEILLPLRLNALRGSPRLEAARARARDFEDRSPGYRAVKNGPPADSITRAAVLGLTLWMPKAAARDASLARRVQTGWLPLEEVALVRDVALGAVALDIGANIGTTSLPRVILGDAGMVLAAEPDPVNYECLVRNVVENGLEGFVLADRIALSDTVGEAWLKNTHSMGSHQLSAVPVEPHKGIVVPITTVDAWLATHDVAGADVGFVKCDTQGWESHVLEGAASLLQQPHVVWQIELHPGLLQKAGTDVRDFLASLAVRFGHFIDLRGSGRRVRATADLATSLDYLLTRRDERYTDLLLFGPPA